MKGLVGYYVDGLLLRIAATLDARSEPRGVPEERFVRRLTLAEYRDLLSGTPVPTREQLDHFAQFVSTAHSWYKHLPTLPPGIQMFFYLDPGAGMQRLIGRRGRARGRVREVERKEHGFHYSWLPTSEYRDRFGHAAYAATSGTRVSLVGFTGSEQAPSDDEPLVVDTQREELVGLPLEVLQAGSADVSGVIHPRAAAHRWVTPPGYDDPARVDWPEESGGRAAYAQIHARVEELRSGATPVEVPDAFAMALSRCDLILHRLLIPERERQQRGMVAALERVIALVR